MDIDWRSKLFRKGNRMTLSGTPIAMHCHHYNINLQKMLEDTMGDDGVRLLYKAAESSGYSGFQTFFNQHEQIKTVKSKLEFATAAFQICGLGIILFQNMESGGGRVISPSSHHVTGWLAKHGRRDSPGCHFSRGWLAGVLEVVFDHPVGYYSVAELQCKMMKSSNCIFEISAPAGEIGIAGN